MFAVCLASVLYAATLRYVYLFHPDLLLFLGYFPYPPPSSPPNF
jgi:hypothetical protein